MQHIHHQPPKVLNFKIPFKKHWGFKLSHILSLLLSPPPRVPLCFNRKLFPVVLVDSGVVLRLDYVVLLLVSSLAAGINKDPLFIFFD